MHGISLTNINENKKKIVDVDFKSQNNYFKEIKSDKKGEYQIVRFFYIFLILIVLISIVLTSIHFYTFLKTIQGKDKSEVLKIILLDALIISVNCLILLLFYLF